jgi:hypothetical protein
MRCVCFNPAEDGIFVCKQDVKPMESSFLQLTGLLINPLPVSFLIPSVAGYLCNQLVQRSWLLRFHIKTVRILFDRCDLRVLLPGQPGKIPHKYLTLCKMTANTPFILRSPEAFVMRLAFRDVCSRFEIS